MTNGQRTLLDPDVRRFVSEIVRRGIDVPDDGALCDLDVLPPACDLGIWAVGYVLLAKPPRLVSHGDVRFRSREDAEEFARRVRAILVRRPEGYASDGKQEGAVRLVYPDLIAINTQEDVGFCPISGASYTCRSEQGDLDGTIDIDLEPPEPQIVPYICDVPADDIRDALADLISDVPLATKTVATERNKRGSWRVRVSFDESDAQIIGPRFVYEDDALRLSKALREILRADVSPHYVGFRPGATR